MIRTSDHTLACSVSGKPPPQKMSWIKRLNGVDTAINQTGKKYSGGTIDCPSLTIKDFDMPDEGAYICQAINDAGEGFSEALYLSCIGEYFKTFLFFHFYWMIFILKYESFLSVIFECI